MTRRFTPDDLARILAKQSYTLGSVQVYPAVAPALRHPEPEHDAGAEPLVAGEDEGGGAGRITVRITRFGTKLLDKDNLYGGVKYVCDALRYANLIPQDDPESIDLQVRQKTTYKHAQGTLIEIIHP